MQLTVLIIIISQLTFSASDLLARHFIPLLGFRVSSFLSAWFAVYLVLRAFGMLGQLYVLSNVDLGRTMALFGVSGLVLANILGLLVLREHLSLQVYVGITVAVLAFMVVGFAKQ